MGWDVVGNIKGPAGSQGPQGDPGTPGAAGASGGIIRKTANQVMTLTAATDVNDMAFTAAPNSSYFFMMNIQVTTSTGTSPTTAWSFTGPSGATVAIVGEIDTSTSVEASQALVAWTAFTAGAQVANTGARFVGIVQTGATGGVVQLKAARGGTSPSMNVAAGSNGFFMKVA